MGEWERKSEVDKSGIPCLHVRLLKRKEREEGRKIEL